MKINREKFLERLSLASLGVSTRGLVEQADAFIFDNGKIKTYSGSVMVEVKGLKDIRAAVNPVVLVNLLKKLSDAEIDISQDANGQLVIEGEGKKATLATETDIRLDLTDVPPPGDWVATEAGVMSQLRRAAQTCGLDESWGAATCVHVTKNVIEASDNFRLFRWEGKTGFTKAMFIPADAIELMSEILPEAVSVNGGWAHFKVSGATISARGRELEKYPDMSTICDVKGSDVHLPKGLDQISDRAMIVAEGDGHATRISVDISPGKGLIKSRSAKGKYRETFKLKYEGPNLSFDVHPKILVEIVEFSPKVVVGENRIRAVVDDAVFVIALRQAGAEG